MPLRTIGQLYCAQTWESERLLSEVNGLSYDAARHVAQTATVTGHTGRMMSVTDDGTYDLACDWTEVFCPDGSVRVGRFAETTLVRTPETVKA